MAKKYPYDDGSDIMDSLPRVEEYAATYLYATQPRNDIEYINTLKRLIGLKLTTLARWLNITPRTFKNYLDKGDITLKENLREHIIMVLSLYRHGTEVFGNVPDFEAWLSAKNVFLDNKAPADFLDTISGIRFIDSRLTAMEYGDNV
ncbi:MAG: DUF2384 domain-containing protein [Chitinophagaceae bacterium]|nr:DUF2384 domain-containing protein [Chitinophagaceae bacterium]